MQDIIIIDIKNKTAPIPVGQPWGVVVYIFLMVVIAVCARVLLKLAL